MTRTRTLLASVAALALATLACLDPTAMVEEQRREARLAEEAATWSVENEVADVKPAAAPEPVAAADPYAVWSALSVPDLVAAIGNEITWEPYAGVLRGPEGTAAAMAGNAWDRSLLLGAILAGRGEIVRYATADLPDDLVDTLLGTWSEGDGGAVEGLAPWDPAADPALRERVRHHVWLQVERDGAWVSLDPSEPAGGGWLEPTAVWAAPPPEAFQRLSIALDQRTVGGEVHRMGVIEGTVVDMAAAPVSVVAVGTPRIVPAAPAPNPDADPTGLGAGLDQGITGLGLSAPPPAAKPGERLAVQVRRTLTGPTPVEATPWTVRTADPSTALAAEWLEITLSVPGEPDRVVQRPLWEAREGSEASLRRYTIGVFPRRVRELDVKAAKAEVEALPPDSPETEPARGETVGRFVVIAAAAAMDALTDQAAADAHVAAIRHQPRVYVAALETTMTDGAATTAVSLDLGLDEVLAMPRDGAPTGAATLFQRGRGIASSSVEGEVLEALSGKPAVTTAALTQRAAAEGIALVTLAPGDALADLEGLAESDASRISGALAAGHTIVLPQRAVPIDGRPTWGWWDVDPATGAYVGVMEGGGHQAVLEYSVTIETTLNDDTAYAMGLIVGAAGTEGLIALMAIKYEFAAITPEIAKEIAATLESIVCKVCPSAGASYSGSISLGSDCYEIGKADSGASVGAGIDFCGAYLEGVKCSMGLVLQGLPALKPGVSGSSGGTIDIPFKCGGD